MARLLADLPHRGTDGCRAPAPARAAQAAHPLEGGGFLAGAGPRRHRRSDGVRLAARAQSGHVVPHPGRHELLEEAAGAPVGRDLKPPPQELGLETADGEQQVQHALGGLPRGVLAEQLAHREVDVLAVLMRGDLREVYVGREDAFPVQLLVEVQLTLQQRAQLPDLLEGDAHVRRRFSSQEEGVFCVPVQALEALVRGVLQELPQEALGVARKGVVQLPEELHGQAEGGRRQLLRGDGLVPVEKAQRGCVGEGLHRAEGEAQQPVDPEQHVRERGVLLRAEVGVLRVLRELSLHEARLEHAGQALQEDVEAVHCGRRGLHHPPQVLDRAVLRRNTTRLSELVQEPRPGPVHAQAALVEADGLQSRAEEDVVGLLHGDALEGLRASVLHLEGWLADFEALPGGGALRGRRQRVVAHGCLGDDLSVAMQLAHPRDAVFRPQKL